MKEKLVNEIKKLKLSPSQEIIDGILSDSDFFEKKMKDLKLIDVDNVEPMVRVDETPTSWLREDKPGKTMDKKDFLDNAPETDGDYILIKKVVAND